MHLLQVRPLPQEGTLHPTHLNLSSLQLVGEALPMVPGNCRARILEAGDEIHEGKTVGEARRTFLELPKAKQEKVKVIFVSTPGGSNSHEATEFRANNLPVLCVAKEYKTALKASLENKRMLLVADVVDGRIGAIQRSALQDCASSEETLIKMGIIVEGWSKHPLPAIQSMTGEGFSEEQLNAFLGELLEACIEIKIFSEAAPANAEAKLQSLFSLLKRGKLGGCSYQELIERSCSPAIEHRISSMAMILKVAYALCIKFKRTPLKERALAVSRQLIADAQDVWNAHKSEGGASQMQKLYALNWLRAGLTQWSEKGVADVDSPLTLLNRYNNLVAAKKILAERGGKIDDRRAEMLSLMLSVGNCSLNEGVFHDWRTFCSGLCVDGSEREINRLALVLSRIVSVDAAADWLHALFIPEWQRSKNASLCLKRLIIKTSRSIEALDKAGSLRAIAERFEMFRPQLASEETFDKYWSKIQKDLPALDEIPRLYMTQNAFGRSLFTNAFGEVLESYDGMVKEMLGQPGLEERKVRKLQKMLQPYVKMMQDWLKLVESKDVPGHDDVQEINRQIGEIAAKLLDPALLQTPNMANQLNVSARFNVAAAQVGSGVNFKRHEPKTLADVFTLAHQNILFALAYLQNKEDVFTEYLPTAVRNIANAVASTKMLNMRMEEEFQRFEENRPSRISMTVDFPIVTMRFNAPQRNHSAIFEITAELDPQTRGVKTLKVGGKLFGYQAHDMPRMPWAAAYAELCARAGGFNFSLGGMPTYDRSRDMVEFTWIVDESQVEKLTHHIQDYLKLITTSLYTGSRSRHIPIPQGDVKFSFTSNWGMPKLDNHDNNTTLEMYYLRKDVDLGHSSAMRFKEAVENIKVIHPEWDSSGLRYSDVESISAWHKFTGQPC